MTFNGGLVPILPLTAIKVAPTYPDGVELGHWTPDRPDPYVCEYLGLNGCWQPSEPSEGPPYSHDGHWPKRSKICVVNAHHDPAKDDAPAILGAFAECRSDGHIIFDDTTYHIRTVMNTTGLRDVSIELRGTLKWSDDIFYWLNNSIPIGFQNQTSAWHLGGERIHFFGRGSGTLDGNGQVLLSPATFRRCVQSLMPLGMVRLQPRGLKQTWSTSSSSHYQHETFCHRRSAIYQKPDVVYDGSTLGKSPAARHLHQQHQLGRKDSQNL